MCADVFMLTGKLSKILIHALYSMTDWDSKIISDKYLGKLPTTPLLHL